MVRSDDKVHCSEETLLIIFLLLWEFFTWAIADGFFTGDWVTASLLKSPGLFSVFWPILVKPLSEWSLICPLISKSSSPFTNLSGSFQLHQLPLISSSLSCSITSSAHQQGPNVYPPFHFLLILLFGLPGRQTPQFSRFSFLFFSFFFTITQSDRLAEIKWSVYISKSQRS